MNPLERRVRKLEKKGKDDLLEIVRNVVPPNITCV